MIEQTDEAALAAIIERHVRGPFSWEQEPGVFVKVGSEGLAKRLIMKLKAARAVELLEDGDHYVGRDN
jgi:hypothetical protein